MTERLDDGRYTVRFFDGRLVADGVDAETATAISAQLGRGFPNLLVAVGGRRLAARIVRRRFPG
jgi:hypothetical protein